MLNNNEKDKKKREKSRILRSKIVPRDGVFPVTREQKRTAEAQERHLLSLKKRYFAVKWG